MSKNEYMVSVVTPFHNVDMEMFSRCAESLRKQTIGFENIQWIVVLHNCDSGYKETLSEMFKNDRNVVLEELLDDAKTPSSPRNHGTRLATAPYIGYLDGDDQYTPECLEIAAHEARETKSQMVWFRREQEKEDPSMKMPMATTLWNNTLDRIVVEKGKWEDEKMFDALFGFATSYLYEREFLVSHQLSFDEAMLFGEDFLFVVETAAQAERICYLPQLIGYHYYVNGNSMVQNGEKSAELLIQYARGFRHLFDVMQSYGIDFQENSQIQCGFILARFILSSPKLTVDDRRKIKEILGPYVNRMVLLPPSKSFDKIARRLMLRLSHDVILNPENPGATLLKIKTDGLMELSDILEQNAETDMGKRYKFDKLNSVAAFQNRIPLTDINFYKPLVKLQTNVGEKNILTSCKISRYFSSPDGNLVPCTKYLSKKYAEYFASLLSGHSNFLVARSLPVKGMTNDGAEIDSLQSAIVKDYFSGFFYKGGVQQAHLTSSVQSYFKQDQSDDDYRDLMVDALATKDIDQIVAFTTDELLTAFKTLESCWPQMVNEIADQNRKKEVETILSEGFEKPVVEKLWPNLKRIVAYGAGEMYESFRTLKRYTGNLPHNHGYDFMKETILGKAVGDDTELFECLQNNNFYELMPIDGDDDAKPLCWSQVEVGKSYFVVVTNHAGLYRYQTSHIIRPREITPESIKFTIY